MFKHYFEQMEDISRYPVFSLLVFLTFFVGIFLWAVFAKKGFISYMSQLPLEDGTPNPPKTYGQE